MLEQYKALKTEILSPVRTEMVGLFSSSCTEALCSPRSGLPRRHPVRKARGA